MVKDKATLLLDIRRRLRPKVEWRWYVYVPLLVISAGWFITGYLVRMPQQVVFSGEIVHGSDLTPGTEWSFETNTLSEGTLSTVADGISGLLSSGRPMILQFNVGPETCQRLESSGFLQSPSVKIKCDTDSGLDLIEAVNVELNIDFGTPTSVIVRALGASNILFRAGGLAGDFPASLEIAVSRFDNTLSPKQVGRCADVAINNLANPALLVNVQNQRKDQAIFELDSDKMPVTFWPGSMVGVKTLCLFINTSGEELGAALTTRYRQTFMPVSANYTTDNVDIETTNGRITVGGDSKTLLRADAIHVRSKQAGLLSLSNDQVDFELPKAYVVCKGVAASPKKCADQQPAGADLKRRWLETWPPWLQAAVGVLVSGLGLQVIIPLIVPNRLKR